MNIGQWLLYIVGGFLLGSVMFCRLLPVLIKKQDICELSDDHNPGAANVFKLYGVPLGMTCLILDMSKGFFPVWLALCHLGTDDWLFAAVMAAPVLGHALAPLNGWQGGKCIATSFGEMIALVPATFVGLILAGLYILFSTVIPLRPHRLRSITTFALFGLLVAGILISQGRFPLALGCVLVSLTAIVKHYVSR